MSIGHFQTSAMDTTNVLPECLLVLEIVRMQAATIKPNPGAMEPYKGIDCLDVIVGRFLVGKTPPTALCQAIIVLRGGTPSILLKFSWLGHRSRWMSHP